MNDMRAVIVPKSDQINADDLLGGPINITITGVSIRPGTEQPVSINFDGDGGKPYKPCKSMARVMVNCWGPDANAYVGRSMTLYCDPKVKWGGMAVGGIRISHMSHIEGAQTMPLTETKGSRKPFTVKPLVVEKLAPKRTMADLLSELQGELDAFTTEAEVQALVAREIVQKVLATPGNGATKLNAMIKAALDRVAVDVPTEDEGLPDYGAEFDSLSSPAAA